MATHYNGTKAIIDNIMSAWLGNPINGIFYFGLPQDIDNLHNKPGFPLMLCLKPELQLKAEDINKGSGLCHTSFTLLVYDNTLPSDYNNFPKNQNKYILVKWDELENHVINWFYEFCKLCNIGDGIVDLTTPLQITRMQESGNDRLLALKITFSLTFFRTCRTFAE